MAAGRPHPPGQRHRLPRLDLAAVLLCLLALLLLGAWRNHGELRDAAPVAAGGSLRWQDEQQQQQQGPADGEGKGGALKQVSRRGRAGGGGTGGAGTGGANGGPARQQSASAGGAAGSGAAGQNHQSGPRTGGSSGTGAGGAESLSGKALKGSSQKHADGAASVEMLTPAPAPVPAPSQAAANPALSAAVGNNTPVGSASSGSAGGASAAAESSSTSGPGRAGNAAAPVAAPAAAPAAVPAERRQSFTFYSVGAAYHHLPACRPGVKYPGAGCDTEPCPVPWEWTRDKQSADALIFNTLDGLAGFEAEDPRARPGQWLVMMSMESGKFYPAVYEARDKGFNISADYRLATAEVPIAYYSREELGDLRRPPLPFKQKRKDVLVAVFVSNCAAKNNRTAALFELMKYLPDQVHSYGKCYHNKDPDQTAIDGKQRAEQKSAALSSYKFTFVPENSDDEGYVTEKVYQALNVGTVPIYMGAPDIDRFIPVPEAVIKVSDYKGMLELTDYLLEIADDERRYNKHLAWKDLPEKEWGKGWRELQRLQRYSVHCRIAMHMAGRPHKWRDEDVEAAEGDERRVPAAARVEQV